jgi:hypothetical protein
MSPARRQRAFDDCEGGGHAVFHRATPVRATVYIRTRDDLYFLTGT